MLDDLLKRRVLFCGGKGGVGKTTVAAALGMLAARAGRRVLVASTDPAHSLGDLFERRLSDRPAVIEAGLQAMELDPDRAVDAYLAEVAQRLREYVKPALYDEVDRQMDQARHAPGATEAALLERVAGILAEPPEDTDLVIFDTAPTGHTLRLISLPETMAAWTEGLLGRHQQSEELGKAFRSVLPGGQETAADQRRARLAAALERRRRKFRQAREVITDPGQTGFVMVLIPERLPVEETTRAVRALEQARVPVACLVVNQVLPEDVDGEFMRARRQVQEPYLEQVEERFGTLPRIYLPLFKDEVRAGRGLEEMMDAIRKSPMG